MDEFAWIAWLVLILIFVIIEMLTVDLVFLMLAIGSLFVGRRRVPVQ